MKGGRFLTLNTVVGVSQIEAACSLNEGVDEAAGQAAAANSNPARRKPPGISSASSMPIRDCRGITSGQSAGR